MSGKKGRKKRANKSFPLPIQRSAIHSVQYLTVYNQWRGTQPDWRTFQTRRLPLDQHANEVATTDTLQGGGPSI